MNKLTLSGEPILFDRVASILDQARGHVLRTVNQQMVLAYGLIGREIVLEVQNGKHKASYGDDVIRDLSAKLTAHYGKGYSLTHIKDMRQFYVLYRERIDVCPKFSLISHTSGGFLEDFESKLVFSAKLGWSHYRSLMRIKNPVSIHVIPAQAGIQSSRLLGGLRWSPAVACPREDGGEGGKSLRDEGNKPPTKALPYCAGNIRYSFSARTHTY